LRIVDDQFGAPTSAADIADACLVVAERIAAGVDRSAYGVFHYTGADETTWRKFAEAIFEVARPWAGIRAKVIPIPTLEYPTPARRPANSRLDCTKIKDTFGIEPRPWRASLGTVLAEIRQNQGSTGS
jgi:dTDP-4-dehydrorhamnose reductase